MRRLLPALLLFVILAASAFGLGTAAVSEKNGNDIDSPINDLLDTDSHVRSDAAWTLGMSNDSRAVNPLIETLKDNDGEVQYWAAEALGKIGKPAVEPLIRALKDDNSSMREIAARTLG
jgi:HEAT repeat protein